MKAKFNIIYVPDTINGKKNIEKKISMSFWCD